ncbi:deaminase [Gordonia sp. TBRC 11910]|uniref:Deaminase n=1 Tax=Gordonia asplenii TaxID=2725283 RepID=A0A848KY72_9ACTN|nr:dihydrofolate reductase family protein [Gordonia asplenii]NMO01805.1 deaminase [Gordonia asplenii]
MRPIRYSINITLDGCCDHREGIADRELHERAEANIREADAIILGRKTFQMMEEAWRVTDEPSPLPDWMQPFGVTIDAAKKYVVSSTLPDVDWNNSELLRGDLRTAIEELKAQPGGSLAVGGVQLPLALAQWDLIDEYEFVVHPRIAGHGPTLLAGLPSTIDLRQISRYEYASGVVANRYEVRR